MSYKVWMLIAAILTLPIAVGCDPLDERATEVEVESEARADGSEHEHQGEHLASAPDEHSLHGWWCTEHGVPEEVCALCNSKVAAEFQKRGDWCEEHNRPDSQCFIHHPELKDKFAALYEAKYGEQPPEPQG